MRNWKIENEQKLQQAQQHFQSLHASDFCAGCNKLKGFFDL